MFTTSHISPESVRFASGAVPVPSRIRFHSVLTRFGWRTVSVPFGSDSPVPVVPFDGFRTDWNVDASIGDRFIIIRSYVKKRGDWVEASP